MVLPNFPFVSVDTSGGVPAGDFYAPNHANVRVSDYYAVAITAPSIRFTRPILDGQGFENTSPGARIRFVTNASRIDVMLNYTNLVTRVDTYNGKGAIYANGVLVDTFDRGQGAAGGLIATHNFGSSATRTIEVLLPYCASVDYAGVYVSAGATFTAAAARPVKTLIVHGESVEQGFNGTSVEKAWPFLMGVSLGVQMVNGGYGGRLAVATDGTAVGTRANADGANSRVLCVIGANDCYAQIPLATFKTAVAGFITNLRAAAPSAKIIMLGRMVIPAIESLPIPFSSYRTKVSEAVSESVAGNVFFVDGSGLGPTNPIYFTSEQIHYNDAGHAITGPAVATAISSLM